MGCNCKSDLKTEDYLDDSKTKKPINFKNIGFYSLKLFAFLILLVLLPILNLYIIWLMFNIVVLNKNVDIKPLLKSIGDKFREKDNDEDVIDDEEFDNLTEEDVVLMDSEDLTVLNKTI